MNATRHADLARQLVDAVGGLKKAVAIARIGKSRLYLCMKAGSGAFLAIDVINDLERACGRRIYTQAVADAWNAPATQDDLRTEAEETTEAAAEAMRAVRESLADDKLDPKEKRRVRKVRDRLVRQVQDFSAVVDQVAA